MDPATPTRHTRWSTIAGSLLAFGALAGLIGTGVATRRDSRRVAERALASSVAEYFSITVPADSAGFRLPRLLIGASLLADASLWNAGLQVGWRGSPLLPDTVGLTPLDAADGRMLREPGAVLRLQRDRAGEVTLVPLIDPGLRQPVGWVAVWGAVRFGHDLPLTLALALVAGLGTVIGLHLAEGGESSRRRRMGLAIALGGALLLAAQIAYGAWQDATTATDAMLLRQRRLIEVAALSPRLGRVELARLVPGGSLWPQDRPTVRADVVTRIHVRGVTFGQVTAAVRNGRSYILSARALEADLRATWGVLIAWLAVYGAGLAMAYGGTAAAGARLRAAVTRTSGLALVFLLAARYFIGGPLGTP